MGSWFKTILKKGKKERSKKSKRNRSRDGANGASNGNPAFLNLPLEDVAATRIQTAYRGYKARKTLRRLKGVVRFKALSQGQTVQKQASTTLNYLHSWCKIQAEIRTRRLNMITEGRIRQKKLENQMKLETKLHDLEVEWSGTADTMEEILARIQQREDASVKRERAMAYAFSHQWRANSNQNHGRIAYEANWGWSWVERWIAARPWESRIPVQSISPKKVQSKQLSKAAKNPNSPGTKNLSPSPTKLTVSVKPTVSIGKGTVKAKGPFTVNGEKKPAIKNSKVAASLSPSKPEKTSAKQEQVAS